MSDIARSRASLENRQKIHLRNLEYLEQQADRYGMDVPLHLKNQIDYIREELAKIAQQLASLGGGVSPTSGESSGINLGSGNPRSGITISVGGDVAGHDIVKDGGGTPRPISVGEDVAGHSIVKDGGRTPRPIPTGETPKPAELPVAMQQVRLEFQVQGKSATIIWRATVLGSRRTTFSPPYNSTTLPIVIRALDYAQGGEQSFEGDEPAVLERVGLWRDGDVPVDAHRIVGQALYRALGNEGKSALEAVRNYSITQGLPTSYILRFPRGSVSLAALPWEALWDGDKAVLLARGSDVDSIERYMDIEQALPPPPLAAGQKLHLLALSPNYNIPKDVREAERAARLASWSGLRDAGLITFDEISPLTTRALSNYLRSAPRPPDIIHYFGHGSYRNGEGYLQFDNSSNGVSEVSATRLAALLGNVRLVVLHACQSAMVTSNGGLLTGIAPALSLVSGAVVAMQLSVRIDAATRFAEVFYDELLQRRRSLQDAVAEGRQTLFFEEEDGASWYVPTLYIRSREEKPLYLLNP